MAKTKIRIQSEPQTVSFTLRLPKAVADRLDRKRKKHKLSRQKLILEMIDQLVDDLEIDDLK